MKTRQKYFSFLGCAALLFFFILCLMLAFSRAEKNREAVVVHQEPTVTDAVAEESVAVTNIPAPNLGVIVLDRGGTTVVQSSTKDMKGPVAPPNPYLKGK